MSCGRIPEKGKTTKCQPEGNQNLERPLNGKKIISDPLKREMYVTLSAANIGT
jgi:hypothetical protein